MRPNLTPNQAFAVFVGTTLFGGVWAVAGWQFTSAAYAVGFAASLVMAFGLVFFTKQTIGLIRRVLAWPRRTDKFPHEPQARLSQSPQGDP